MASYYRLIWYLCSFGYRAVIANPYIVTDENRRCQRMCRILLFHIVKRCIIYLKIPSKPGIISYFDSIKAHNFIIATDKTITYIQNSIMGY